MMWEKEAVVVLLLVVLATAVFSYTQSGSTIEQSTIIDCSGEQTHLIDSIVNRSTVECANITNSTLFYSSVRDATVNLSDAILNFASVSGGVLTSGQMIYNGYSYYGPFALDDIYAGIPPSDTGVLSFSSDAVNGTGTFYVMYSIGRLGFTVTLDATNVGAGAAIAMVDDGTGNDAVANDGTYTTTDIAASTGAVGSQNLIASINDGLGNQWSLTKAIYLDNTAPSGTFYISDASENKDSTETDSRVVNLHMTASDNYGISGCRYANNGTDITTKAFESCSSTAPFILEAINGVKKVNYQILDEAGNLKTYSDTITLASPVLPAPTVDDDADYWGYDDRVNFALSYPSGTQTQGVTYEFRVYNCTAKDNSCNVTPWTYTELSDVWAYNLSLVAGPTYYIGAIAYSGGVSSEAFSDGFILDLSAPTFTSLTADVANATWTSQSVIAVTMNATDAESGIEGFSYRVGTSDLDPDDVIDAIGGNKIIYLTGLSEGTYYFNTKAKSNAKQFSSVKKYLFYVDTTAPSIPYTSTPNASGGGTLRFSWTSVSDISNVTSYNVVVASDSAFENVVGNYSTANTYYDYSAPSGSTYYFKVRAQNGAGLYSLFSNQYNFLVDTQKPTFLSATPSGLVLTEEPVLHLETDEAATCKYKLDSDSTYAYFAYTGSRGHDQRLDLTDGNSYTYNVICTDEAGNYNTTSLAFSIDTTKTVSSITPAVSTLTTYRSLITSFDVDITSGGTGVSGLRLSSFDLQLDGRSVSDFTIVDKGSGLYTVSFAAPDTPGTYDLVLTYGRTSSNAITATVNDLTFEVSVDLGSGSTATITELSHLSYANENNYVIGLATESDTHVFNGSQADHKLSIVGKLGSESLIFLTTANQTSSLKNKNRLLDGESFLALSNPNFGSGSRSNLVVDLILSYQNIVFHGVDQSSRGEHNIKILNEGLTQDKKINISVSIT